MRKPTARFVRWLQEAAKPGGLAGIFLALSLVAGMTLALFGLRLLLPLPPIAMTFLVPVMVAAIQWGILSSVIAAIAGVMSSAYFFYQPIYSLDFTAKDPARVLSLILFIVVAVVTGHLAARSRREEEIARKRENDIRDLYAFSRRLAAVEDAAGIFDAIQKHLSSLVSRQVVLFGPPQSPRGTAERFGGATVPDTILTAISELSTGRRLAGTELDDRGNLWLVRAVSPKTLDFGVIAIDLGPPSRKTEDIRERIDAILADAATTLENLDVGRTISEARMRTETARFREALIGSVSHELRTPLASILGANAVLRQAPAVAAEPKLLSLANVVREEAERLNSDIQNLLDATRISSQGLQAKYEWTDPADIVNAAVERRRTRLADREVDVRLEEDLPLVYVDSVLVEQAFGQLLDNAIKYSESGSPIRLTGRCKNGQVVLAVSDRGAGLSAEEAARMSERFYRGSRHVEATVGSGLGLWIANAFLAANGGALQATSDGENRGATISIHLPVPEMERQREGLAHE
jgi:two-component system sensor histidine kinase KdpD